MVQALPVYLCSDGFDFSLSEYDMVKILSTITRFNGAGASAPT